MFLVVIKPTRFIKNNDLILEVESVVELKQLMSLMIHDYDYCIVDNELNLNTGVRVLTLDYLGDVDVQSVISKTRIKNNFNKYRKGLVHKKELTYTHIKFTTPNVDGLDDVLDDIDGYISNVKISDGTKIFCTGQDIYLNHIDVIGRVDIIQFGSIVSSNCIVKDICKILNDRHIQLDTFELC